MCHRLINVNPDFAFRMKPEKENQLIFDTLTDESIRNLLRVSSFVFCNILALSMVAFGVAFRYTEISSEEVLALSTKFKYVCKNVHRF